MTLTRSLVISKAKEYREHEPLYPVEQESIETLPAAFRAGEFGWRDVEWVIRWTGRRFLGAIPNATRRKRETAFDRNSFEEVRDAIVAATKAPDPADRIDQLTALEGVDVPVASAILLFVDPDTCIVIGEREWTVLFEHGHLDDPYPEPPSRSNYETYLDTCRSLTDQLDCDMWTLYRACWRLWDE